MTKLFLGLVSLPFIASVAMAGQPVALTNTQMDKVTAGAITDQLTYTEAIEAQDELLDTNFVINKSITAKVSIPQVNVRIPGPLF